MTFEVANPTNKPPVVDGIVVSAVGGGDSNKARRINDSVATVAFSNNLGQAATLSKIRVSLSGSALRVASGTTAMPPVVDLIDADTGVSFGAFGIGSPQECVFSGVASESCAADFFPAYVMQAGTVKTLRVVIDSNGLANSAAEEDSLTVSIVGEKDIAWIGGSGVGAGTATVVNIYE